MVDSYQSAMRAFDAALQDPPKPDSPLLEQWMVDPMLSTTKNLAAEWRGFGQASRYPDPSVHRIDVLSVAAAGDTAQLEACDVDDGVIYEAASGKVLNDNVTTALDAVSLKLVDGSWRLSTREQKQKWQGVAGCAISQS